MEGQEQKIAKAIEEFYTFLDKYPDEPKSLSIFMRFLKEFLKIPTKNQTLPTIEIMTVLKQRKPIIFSIMRRQTNNVLYNILTQVEMELEVAEQKLNELLKKSVP